MLVSEVMSATLEFVAPDATVQAAAVLMGELEVGALPVGRVGDLQGIITDRDILYRVVAEGLNSADVRVRQAMTATVFTCRETDTLAQALDLMGAYHVRRLPVLNADDVVSGWISLADISRVMLQESGAIAGALEELSAPERAA
jgi:CBS domain-containing protein